MSPVRLELASITSASGTVTVANADNSMTGVGATWDYSNKLGADNSLTPNETSAARNIRFNNPRAEAFTVTFKVFGNLDRASAGSTFSMTSSSTSSSKTQTDSSTAFAGTAGGSPASAAAASGLLFKLIYNPLLNTVTVQLVSP